MRKCITDIEAFRLFASGGHFLEVQGIGKHDGSKEEAAVMLWKTRMISYNEVAK